MALQLDAGAEAWPMLLDYFYTDRLQVRECVH